MARYPVLQPNGNYAVWSTIVDGYVAIECDREEATAAMREWYSTMPLADFNYKLDEAFKRLADGHAAFDWASKWNNLLPWQAYRQGLENEMSVAIIDAGLCSMDDMIAAYQKIVSEVETQQGQPCN